MITGLLDAPLYSGAGSSSEVPGLFPVGLGGHSYLIDLKSGDFKNQSVPILRSQADQGASPGESSINPEDLWRRSQETWTSGAGQSYLDRVTGQSAFTRSFSDPGRFHLSKGVNPWTGWQLTLLPDTGQKQASANTNLALVVAGSRLYLIDGTALSYTADITVGSPTWTAVTGTPGAAPTSIASDGHYVYTAHTASGIYLTNKGTGATAQWISPGTATLVRYAKGRLMAAYQNLLYNVTTSTGTAGPTALPAPLLTQPNSDFVWVDIAEGQGQIYAAGYSGDKSLIYRTAVKADGTALDVPVVAGELPDGEIVRAIQGYLGFLVIGTDLGVRLASSDSSGNLTIGPILNTGTISVRCFEPQDRFVWFGWTNYDTASTGLGRLDLSVFTATLAPAFASDLMATGQGTVLSVATFQNTRVFAVSALGVYGELTTRVASGTLDSGQITYGIPDAKVGMWIDIRTEPLPTGTSIEVFLSTDGGAFNSLGTFSTSTAVGNVFPVAQIVARRFEIRLKLNGTSTLSPTIIRNTMRAYSAPNRAQQWTVPLLLHEVIKSPIPRSISPQAELDYIKSMVADKRLVVYQEGSRSYSVFVEDWAWDPHHPTADGTFWNGTCVVKLKETST